MGPYEPKLPGKTRTSARPTLQRPQEWGSIIRALQGNHDYLNGFLRVLVKVVNSHADDLRRLRDVVTGTVDTVEAISGGSGPGTIDPNTHDHGVQAQTNAFAFFMGG